MHVLNDTFFSIKEMLVQRDSFNGTPQFSHTDFRSLSRAIIIRMRGFI